MLMVLLAQVMARYDGSQDITARFITASNSFEAPVGFQHVETDRDWAHPHGSVLLFTGLKPMKNYLVK